MGITWQPIASSSAGCAYVLRCGHYAPLLIDAGVPMAKLKRAMGFKVSTLEGALISHAHGDHCKAVPDLMSAGIACYGSLETWGQISKKAPRDHATMWRTMTAAVTGQAIPYRIGAWTVVAFNVVHDKPGTLGFVIDSPEGDRFLYATDTAYLPWTFPGLTHLAVECNYSEEILNRNALDGTIRMDRHSRTAHTHMSLERLLKALEANDLSKVKTIWLLHLSDQNSDEAAFKLAVQRATGKEVIVCQKEY